MKPGPKPKPTALKKLAGNPGQRRLSDDEPTPEAAAPERPSFLSEAAAAEWDKIAPKLVAMGVLSTADAAALALYCEYYTRWQDAEKKLREGGHVVKVNGQVMPSPYLSVANKAAEMLLKLTGEFGLTPSARTRVRATKAGAKPTSAAESKPKRGKWEGILKMPASG
jgi:P27 family predicted phage terminase small subunit